MQVGWLVYLVMQDKQVMERIQKSPDDQTKTVQLRRSRAFALYPQLPPLQQLRALEEWHMSQDRLVLTELKLLDGDGNLGVYLVPPWFSIH